MIRRHPESLKGDAKVLSKFAKGIVAAAVVFSAPAFAVSAELAKGTEAVEIATDAAERRRIISMSAIVTGEDKSICERVQANIDAGIYESGVLSPRHEAGVAWFQRLVAKALELAH